MGWSPLSTEVHNTSQYSGRTRPPAGVVLHHGATTSADAIIQMEVSGSRQVSSHQVVKDKRNAGIVQEQFRAWSLSDPYWDSWAFTVECANESTAGWTISNESHETLAQQVANWAQRYGFWPHRSGDPRTWTVIGHREVYTIHGGSYATACPGGMNLDWITARAQEILTKPPKKIGKTTMPILYRIVNSAGYTKTARLVGESGKSVTLNESSNDYKALYAVLEPIGLVAAAYDGNVSVLASYSAKVAPDAGGTIDPKPISDAAAAGAKSGATEAITAAKIPSAADNGKAARDAIVKP